MRLREVSPPQRSVGLKQDLPLRRKDEPAEPSFR